MAVLTDTLATRLELVGLGGYVAGMLQAAEAAGVVDSSLSAPRRRMLGFGIAATAAGAAIAFGLGKAAMAAAEEGAKFSRASNNFKGKFSTDELKAFATELQNVTGVADDSIADFMGLLGTFQIPPDAAKALAMPILDAAEALKANGVTSESLAMQVGKAIQGGNSGALRRSGIFVDEALFKVDRVKAVMQALNSQGKGAAAVFRSTLPGAMMAAGNSIGDLVEEIGTPLVGVLNSAVNGVDFLARSFKNLPGPIKAAVTWGGVALSGALLVGGIAMIAAAVNSAKLTAILLKNAQAHERNAGAALLDAKAQGGFAGAAGAATIAATAANAAAGKGGTIGTGTAGGVSGRLGKGMGKAGKVGGAIGTAAFIAQFAAGALPDTGAGGTARRAIEGAGAGSMWGGIGGGLLGGVLGIAGGPAGVLAGAVMGSRIGSGAGALAGGAMGGLGGGPAAATAPEKELSVAEKQLAATEETNRLMQEQNDMVAKGAFSLDTMPGARQTAAMRWGLKIA